MLGYLTKVHSSSLISSTYEFNNVSSRDNDLSVSWYCVETFVHIIKLFHHLDLDRVIVLVSEPMVAS